MTKTEAVEVLKGFVLYAEKVKSYTFLGDENIPIEALNMAIKALEQKPSEDCISRQDAIEALMAHFVPQTYTGEQIEQARRLAEQIINKVPSARMESDEQ